MTHPEPSMERDGRLPDGGHNSEKANVPSNLPRADRVGRLDTLPRIHREMQRRYRLAAAGLITTKQLSAFESALEKMGNLIWMMEYAGQLDELETIAAKIESKRKTGLIGHA